MLAFLAGRFERLLWGAAAIVIAVALARLLKWAVHRLEQRRPGEERELLQLRRRETAIVLVATAIPYATAIVVLVVVASIFVSRNAAALGGTATFRPEGSIKGSIPGPRSRTCKSTRKRKRRFPALLQNPLTDSNPRPPPTMECISRNRWNRPAAASTLQALSFRRDVTVFRLNARSRPKTGSELAFRRNTAARNRGGS